LKPFGLAVLLAAVLFSVTPANAQFSISITADENCNGLFTNTSGFSQALPCETFVDPGPGGLAAAVTYDMMNPPGLIAGDLEMLDADNTLSDLIRFNDNSFIEGSASFVFYSATDDGVSSLADIGFPTADYENIVTVNEINGGYAYTPTAGQPGFVTGAGGPITYTFTSDESSPTPEPASATLVLACLGLLVGRKYLFSRA